MATTVILLRHGTRDNFGLGDTSLNAVGRAQAEALVEVVSTGRMPVPTRLLPSPKKRAREMLTPLSHSRGLDLQVEPAVDERRQGEAARDFEIRVKAILEVVARGSSSEENQTVLICSHLDWLEAAMVLMPSDLSESEIDGGWSTGEYRVFSIDEGLWRLRGQGIVLPKPL